MRRLVSKMTRTTRSINSSISVCNVFIVCTIWKLIQIESDLSIQLLIIPRFLARDVFARTNRRAIAMMFVRLSGSGTGVLYYHTVHFSADLSLRLNSPMFWVP